MQTNAVTLARLDLLNARARLQDSDLRLRAIMRERLTLRLEIRAAEQRYQDELEAPRWRELGEAAVRAAEGIVGSSPKQPAGQCAGFRCDLTEPFPVISRRQP